jgi:hypothetical protein
MNDLLAFFFIILLCLTVWHLVYQSIFAPTLRLMTRNRLFEQRDHLRRLLMEKRVNQATFQQIQDGINLAIAIQDQISLLDLYRHRRKMQQDKTYCKQIQKRRERLERHSNDESRVMEQQVVSLISGALAINSGAWMPYLVLSILPLFVFNRGKRMVEQAVRPLLVTPLSAESILRNHVIVSDRLYAIVGDR